MNLQPPDPPEYGHCLTCHRSVHESEVRGGHCIECEGQAMTNDMQVASEAAELIETMRPISGEMRVVYQCQGCNQLIGRRFIPFGLGRGLSVNLCMCQAVGPNTPMTRILECRP